MGSSDHHTVLTQLEVGVARDEATTRTIWLWNKTDWASLRRDLHYTPWATLLQGGAESEALALTSHLLALQRRHVPHREYTTRPTDQPWFGYRCRVAARGKVRYLTPLQEEPDSARQEPAQGGMQEDGGNQQVGLKKVGGKPAPETVWPRQPERPLDSLEHRRDVAAVVVFHKAQVQNVPHLAGLRHPLRVSTRSTRTVFSGGDAVEVPRSHGCQHQRNFTGRVSRIWNLFTAVVPHVQEMNTDSIKLMAHKWRQTLPTPLTLIVT
ncbi:hypothetical protein E2C01_074357 [Portunus trituberculatus]|uniref:Endonuclease/exonuclease/phosphatase domain-containing protein n=1 Tax=Portunus trituberculatus TaxID=210409 RepID=A0A5B7I7U4_PORTR|nr:hypothetical protein [Portunus trituberculatus]